jgi:hypothetical protein
MCLSCVIEEVTGFDLQTDEGHEALQVLKEKGGRIEWPKATNEMIECAAYVSALYANPAGGTGGPLHVTVDDYNIDDINLDGCRNGIDNWESYDETPEQELRVKALSRWILDLLYPMSTVERSVTLALAHGSLREVNGHVFMPSTEFPIRETLYDADGNANGWQWGFKTRVVEE